MRFSVESWATEYGSSMAGGDDADGTAEVEVAIERPAADWGPITPAPHDKVPVAFVDGVTRVDAQVWITGDDGQTRLGLCTSSAAGVAVCNSRATIAGIEVTRTLITDAPNATPIETRYGSYAPMFATGETKNLSNEQINKMRALEAAVARSVDGVELLVLDGLIWGRSDLHRAIGYVKTHHAAYLDLTLQATITALEPGQRTPVFLITTKSSRFSWYLRLPGASGHPWAGIVRCEASNEIAPEAAIAMADRATHDLPRFASSAHRDPRAPQNLTPIAGLERELRRRLGDPGLLERALRRAAVA